MTLRARFTLIAFGVIIFAVLGPIIILTARGFRYDFSENRLIRTGTIVIKTDPRKALVFINNIEASDTPFVKRFLLPGEYPIEIKKDGFRTWQKRVAIHEQQVTYLPSGREELFLFLSNPDAKILATSTQDFFADSEDIYYLQNRQVFKTGLDGTTRTLATTTPTDALEEKYYARLKNSESAFRAHGNDHEIWLYITDSQKDILVTRSSEKLGQAEFNEHTGYVFFAAGRAIKGIEFDPNYGQPNVYTFAETKNGQPKFWVNPAGNLLIYQDGEIFYSIKIR